MADSFLSLPWQMGTVVLPLAAAGICFMLPGWLSPVAILVGGGVVLCLFSLTCRVALDGPFRYALGGWGAPLGIDQAVDGPAVLMLLMTALVGMAVSWYAGAYFALLRQQEQRGGPSNGLRRFFWPLWFLLWAGLNNLFLTADIFNQYVSLEIIGLAAVALTSLSGAIEAKIAAMRYLLVNMAASLFFLLGVALLYGRYGVLDLPALGRILVPDEATRLAFALIVAGLLFKSAVFPLHFWLPPAHANALAPVSALLSALVVKAGFYITLRFWFGIFAPFATADAANVMGILGVGALAWGSVQAMRQERFKMLVAWSTVAQLGYLPLILALAGTGEHRNVALFTALLFMMSHATAKAAMFLAGGTIHLALGDDLVGRRPGPARGKLPLTAFALAVAGLALIGTPPGGFFTVKWSILTMALAGGHWWWGIAAMGGSLLAAIYIYRLLRPWFHRQGEDAAIALGGYARLQWIPLCLALTSLALGFLAPALSSLAGGHTATTGGVP